MSSNHHDLHGSKKEPDFSYLTYTMTLLKTVSLWPLSQKSTSTKIFYNFYKFILAASLLMVSVLQIIQICVSPNVTSMASAVDLATLTSAALFRLVYFTVYVDDFKALASKVDGLLVDQNRFHLSKSVMSEWMKRSKCVATLYVASISVVFCVFFVFLPYLATYFSSVHSPLFNEVSGVKKTNFPIDESHHQDSFHLQRNYDVSLMTIKTLRLQEGLSNSVNNDSGFPLNTKYEKLTFPLNCWYPFDVSKSPVCEIVFLFEIFPLLISGHLYLVCDTFFFTVIYLICGYLEVLKLTLRHFDRQCFAGTQNSTEKEDYKILDVRKQQCIEAVMYKEKDKDVSFLSYNLKLMRTIGLWPIESDSYPSLFLYSVYKTLLAVSLAIVSIGMVIEIFVSPNISSMASAIDLFTLTSSALFKLVYIVWYHDYFRKLVQKIDDTFVESSDDHSFSISIWTKYSKIFINIYVASGAVTLCGFFVIVPYLTTYIPVLETPVSFGSMSQSKNLDVRTANPDIYDLNLVQHNSFPSRNNLVLNNNASSHSSTPETPSEPVFKKRKFPFNCWFPFDVTWSPVYEFVFLLEIFPLFGSGHVYLVGDSFFFMIIYLTCGQFEILKASLRSITDKYAVLSGNRHKFDPEVTKSSNGRISPLVWEFYEKEKEFESKLNSEIIKCVDFHCKLIEIIHDLDRLLRSMIVVDFLHAVISLSFALLQTITSSSLYEWMQMLLFIPVCILHQFLNNYFSENLIQQQISVGEVMYEIPWPQSPSTLKTAVMLTTAQARNTLHLSGWRMYWLGLPTFVEFMKLLGSYFLVLQSLHDDEKKHGS